MKLLVSFMITFCFIMGCVVAVAFCGGMQFGTAPFGWLIGFGVFVAVMCGTGAAAAIDESTSRRR
jgi:hypothetical protein